MSEESFVYTACPGWGDHDYCAIKTIVKDGRIVRTEKVEYEEPERCDGHICQKGLLSARQPYSPDRLTAPLKRAGERGEGKWEKISWDQALDEIAQAILRITEEYGPAAIAMWTLPAGVPPSVGLGTLLTNRFTGLWGATDPIMSLGLDNGPSYSSYYQFGNMAMLYSSTDPRNYIGADLIIIWGCNPIENQMRCAQNLVRARDAGARIIDVGLIFDGSAGWADEFIGIRAGSDGYLGLAMANYIIANDLYAADFLRQHSVATYLVSTETGLFARDAQGNYLVWDEATGGASPVAPRAGAIMASAPALLGEYTVDGVAVKTALQLLKERLAPYTPESAEASTGIPAGRVTQLAKEYAAADNAYIVSAFGMRYINQGESYRSQHLLGILTGNLGRPGAGVQVGGQISSYPIVFNDAPIVFPGGIGGYRANCVQSSEFFAKGSSDASPYKAFICMSGNPVHQVPNRGRWLKLLGQCELVVDFDIWMTDTGEMADYVLPDCMPFERMEIIQSAQYNHVVLQEPAIDPPPDVRDAVYLWTELGRRLGLGGYYDKTAEEWLAIRLQSDYPLLAQIDPPLTWDRLKKEKLVRTTAPAEPKFDPFAGLAFDNETGRIEFYVERLLDVGFELPKVTPCLEYPSPEGNDAYPYQLFTGRQRFFMQSMFTNDPVSVELSGGKPSTRMNPQDAKVKQLRDGDTVEVYNDRGHVVTVLEVDESVPPGTIHVWFGWRRSQFDEGTYSEMVAPFAGPGSVDDLARKWFSDCLIAGEPASPSLNPILYSAGAWDAYWDSACNIRKYPAGKEA
ncbi:MAG: molybdopterin-dependent oxidoreductase [Coriobacteriales bacterium]|jgi:molybdopterin-containing oxidoreductase family molybdopterin binding subunit|nr:molybdopterin-dependent oxidoreductase [Coriobacteriales bacterium]